MRREFDECRKLLYDSTLNALKESSAFFASIERTAREELPVTGISLDLYPWHGALTLSLRLSSDFESRYDIGDWKHHDFLSAWETKCFDEAGKWLERFYQAGGSDEYQVRAHLIFLAGAEALLDPNVAKQLQALGVNAPIKSDRIQSHSFEYIVLDSDATVKANYCELVIANRVTHRMLNERTF